LLLSGVKGSDKHTESGESRGESDSFMQRPIVSQRQPSIVVSTVVLFVTAGVSVGEDVFILGLFVGDVAFAWFVIVSREPLVVSLSWGTGTGARDRIPEYGAEVGAFVSRGAAGENEAGVVAFSDEGGMDGLAVVGLVVGAMVGGLGNQMQSKGRPLMY